MPDPFAVRLCIRRGEEIAVEIRHGKAALPVFLTEGREAPQEGAKRIVREECGVPTLVLRALPLASRESIDAFGSEDRASWPRGAKTIGCWSFLVDVSPEAKCPEGLSFVPFDSVSASLPSDVRAALLPL